MRTPDAHVIASMEDQPILNAAFNQDSACFAICHNRGFRVYVTDPMDLRVQREFDDGGIGVIQMLHRTNYLAVVGGGSNPKFPQNKLVIWDDLKSKPALSLEFLSPVLNVLLSRTKIVVVLQNKVHVYAFSSPPSRISTTDTADNPHGIAAFSGDTVVFPSRTPGQIQVVDLSQEGQARNLVSIIRAHKSPVRCVALSADGSVVASCSDNGTLVRLHSTTNTALLHEFRRGLDRAVVYNMAFSPSGSRLAVLSDKNTMHVFDTSASTSGAAGAAGNRRHVLGKVPLLPSYFSGEWSFVSARVHGQHGVLGWSSETSVVVVWISEARWEKYVIVEKKPVEGSGSGKDQPGCELVREAWRAFKDL